MYLRHFTTRAGLSLAADVGGDASDPVVLLLHGARENRHAWSRAARALVSAGRHVVSLDLRGHGDSDWAPDQDYSLDAYVRDVRDVIAQLPSKPAVVGYLLGGLVGLTLAGEDQEDSLSALVLLNTTLHVEPQFFNATTLFSRTMAEGFASVEEAALAVSEQQPYRARIGSHASLRRSLRQGDDGRWRWNYDPADMADDNPRRVTIAHCWDRLQAAAGKVRVPTLVAGMANLVTEAQAQQMQQMMPGAEVNVLPPAEGVGGDITESFDAVLVGFLERVARRADDRPATGGVDPMTMRKAFGNFGTGVTVITTTGPDGKPVGLTANSFTSVSLNPPMVLFCLDHKSSSLPAFDASGSFVVNVLHIGQQDVSNRFMSKGDRWTDTGWETWDTGAPILQDAMACFECDKDQSFDAGDHRIFIGRVRRVWFDPARDPLLYLQGSYRRVHIPH